MSDQQATPTQGRRRTRQPLIAGLCVVAASVMGVSFVADALGGSSPATSSLSSSIPEVFKGIEPVRLLDTRSGVGAPAPGPFKPGETRTVVAAGIARVPSNATSIAINVTLPRSATSTSFVTVWPSGSTQPNTSTSNAMPGQAVPNFAVTALGKGGAINIFNERGNTNIVIDIIGFYVPMPSGGSIAAFGGAMMMGVGAPSDDIGENGDVYIEQVEADVYEKEADTWGEPAIELATDDEVAAGGVGGAGGGPHMIAADGPPTTSDGNEGDVYLDTVTGLVYGPKVGSTWGAGAGLGASGPPTAVSDSAIGATNDGGTLVNASLSLGRYVIPLPDDVVAVGSALERTNAHTITVKTKGTYKVSYSIDAAASLALLGGVQLHVGGTAVESSSFADVGVSIDDVRLVQANANDKIQLVTTGIALNAGSNISASIVVELVAVG